MTILLQAFSYKQTAVYFVGKTILEFSHLESTNDYCRQMAGKQVMDEGTVVWAKHQSKGRGQGKSTWESNEGQNLTFSIILEPVFLDPSGLFFLSMAVSLGIRGFLIQYSPHVSIKWPNDIYIGNRKIAGMLIESSVMGNRVKHSIAGIGININQTSFADHIPNPVSLKQVTYRTFPLRETLISLCSEIESWYRLLIKGEKEKIKNLYTRHLYRLNEKHSFRNDNMVFHAFIRGVDQFGRLELEDEEGFTRHYGMKEVEFLHLTD